MLWKTGPCRRRTMVARLIGGTGIPRGGSAGAFAPRGIANVDGEPTAPSLPGPNGATHAMAATNFGANIDSGSWSVSMWAKLPYSSNISASDMAFYNSYDWAPGLSRCGPRLLEFWRRSKVRDGCTWKSCPTFSNNDLSVSYGGGCCTTRANPGLTEGGDPLASLVDGEWHNIVVTLEYPSFPFPSPAGSVRVCLCGRRVGSNRRI